MRPVTLTDKTRTVGPPNDWVEELDGKCMSLDVYDFVDELTGIHYMRTCWQLEPEDVGKKYIWLDLAGTSFPVMRIFTAEEHK